MTDSSIQPQAGASSPSRGRAGERGSCRLLVLDLDGTLTNDRKEITPRTREALLRAQEQGVRLVLASGRPTYGIVPLARELELARYGGYIMAFNGALITECATGRVLHDQALDASLVAPLHEAAREAGMHILTYQGEAIASTSTTDEYVLHEAFINRLPVVAYTDFPRQVQHPINKCLIVGHPEPLRLLEQRLAAQLEGRMSVYRSAAFFLECVPLGVDKARSLAGLLLQLGLDRERVIACGDGYNDLSMIQYAGLGVAMANACPEVLEAADHITASNEEDGVAQVVERFIMHSS